MKKLAVAAVAFLILAIIFVIVKGVIDEAKAPILDEYIEFAQDIGLTEEAVSVVESEFQIGANAQPSATLDKKGCRVFVEGSHQMIAFHHGGTIPYGGVLWVCDAIDKVLRDCENKHSNTRTAEIITLQYGVDVLVTPIDMSCLP